MNFSLDIKNCNRIINTIAVFLFSTILFSCGSSRIGDNNLYEINFLDEYILENGIQFKGQEIGGLSGIDYNGENFILVSDHSKRPFIYFVDISLKGNSIDNIQFKKSVPISCDDIIGFDTESVRFNPVNENFLLAGEGNINKFQDPVIFEVNAEGSCSRIYDLPDHFEAKAIDGPRSNGVFEGLTVDYKQTGFWVINELPLKRDGIKPKLYNTNSPLRLTHYRFENPGPDFQLSYDLDRLRRLPLLPFGLNGATELLQIDAENILVLERAYSAGHGSKANRIRIFMVNLSGHENLLNVNSLKENKSFNLKKILLFDSKKIKKKLKFRFIDNIEGITFGPKLDNGNNSLILVSDNNFNAFGNQINQFILLEILKK